MQKEFKPTSEVPAPDGFARALSVLGVMLDTQRAIVAEGEAIAGIWRASAQDTFVSCSDFAARMMRSKSPVEAAWVYGDWMQGRYRRLASDGQSVWRRWQRLMAQDNGRPDPTDTSRSR